MLAGLLVILLVILALGLFVAGLVLIAEGAKHGRL